MNFPFLLALRHSEICFPSRNAEFLKQEQVWLSCGRQTNLAFWIGSLECVHIFCRRLFKHFWDQGLEFYCSLPFSVGGLFGSFGFFCHFFFLLLDVSQALFSCSFCTLSNFCTDLTAQWLDFRRKMHQNILSVRLSMFFCVVVAVFRPTQAGAWIWFPTLGQHSVS